MWSDDKSRFQGLWTWGQWPIENIPLEKGRVNYLTIQEGWVEAGVSQRRPGAGLHVDGPGVVKIKNCELEQLAEGQGDSQAYGGHHWGLGCCHFSLTSLARQ